MNSRFVNLFRKNDLDEQRAFQRKVHGVLSKHYPDRIFSLSEDPQTLESDGTTFGLTNLKSKFLLGSQTEGELHELIRAQFDPVINISPILDRVNLDWESAQLKLMPQLMPSEFLERMDLVHLPFGDKVVLGFVLDTDEAYSYIREEDLERWDVNLETLRSQALANLSERSQGIEMTAFPGENGIFVINTMDGFDAVRIVDKKLQELVAEHIGSPFFVGIPNRDFLICWSKNDDSEFQTQMRTQVSSDFDERPYPLSRRVFEVSSDGTIYLVMFDADVPRAIAAENN